MPCFETITVTVYIRGKRQYIKYVLVLFAPLSIKCGLVLF